MPKRYTADHIKVLKDLQAVRKRPSMYIGDTSFGGLHHLVYEVVDNSVDEAMAGFCTEIEVIIRKDGSITVSDNGRGIPVDIHKDEGKPAAEVVMTTLHAGGKFDHNVYKVSGGLHGVGVSVVNALSEYLLLEVRRDGKIYRQEYERGIPKTELLVVGDTNRRGTSITFRPDPTIFETTQFKYKVLSARLKELAYLNKDLTISIIDERAGKKEVFKFEGGIRSLVKELSKGENTLHEEPIFFGSEKDDVSVEVAIQYTDAYRENILTFANNIRTIEGGTHLLGFKMGLTRAINTYAQKEGIKDVFLGDDVREGVFAVVNVKVKDPQFEGQTKTKLGNSKVRKIVESLVNDELSHFLTENPTLAKSIIDKVEKAKRARIAARRAKELARKRALIETQILAGKLADCQNDKSGERELYIVEGESAGGSAKQGRDKRTQAILPLRGKILNVEKARMEKLLSSQELRTLVAALGTGIDNQFDIEKLRYDRIIIMTDADVDGSHIRTLLLTFFYRYMPEIIKRGYLYIAQPPLYRIKKGRMVEYVKDDDELLAKLSLFGIEKLCSFSVKDRKGEMDRERLSDFHRLYLNWKRCARDLGVDSFLLELFVRWYKDHKEILENRDVLSRFAKEVEKEFFDLGILRSNVSFEKIGKDYRISVKLHTNGRSKENFIDKDVISKDIFQYLFELFRRAEKDFALPFVVDGEVIPNYFLFFEKMLSFGRSGCEIQRYKGLGEMNPDQLWATTMDPKTRILLKVEIEDAKKADEVFTILMGEQVEPRRDFICKNALNVRNLDV